MRTMIAAVLAPGFCVAGLWAASAGHAQLAVPTAETACNPDSHPYDAVTAAPYSHRVQFEDEHVRVLEIVLSPGEIEPVHIHALPSVIMGETGGKGGAKFLYREYRYANGKFIETSSNEVSPTAGYRAVWTAPEGPHAITNIGPVEVRFTRVEIKPEACSHR